MPADRVVWHLGDVSFRKNADTVAILKRLHGRIHLIEGNHDNLNGEAKAQFVDIAPYRELKIDGRKVVLCHYPLESWNQMAYGSWHLHGHSHGNLLAFGLRVDVGVDCWDKAGSGKTTTAKVPASDARRGRAH